MECGISLFSGSLLLLFFFLTISINAFCVAIINVFIFFRIWSFWINIELKKMDNHFRSHAFWLYYIHYVGSCIHTTTGFSFTESWLKYIEGPQSIECWNWNKVWCFYKIWVHSAKAFRVYIPMGLKFLTKFCFHDRYIWISNTLEQGCILFFEILFMFLSFLLDTVKLSFQNS